MKKALIIFLFIISTLPVFAEPLKATVSYDEPLKGFYGTWHVTSKMESTNNYSKFNKFSVDIWNLSGSKNVLVLENTLTGAYSAINIDTKSNLDGKTLKFKREKEFSENGYKYQHTEEPEIVLMGNIFKGYDTFTVKKFDSNNKPISIDVVKYKVVGQKI